MTLLFGKVSILHTISWSHGRYGLYFVHTYTIHMCMYMCICKHMSTWVFICVCMRYMYLEHKWEMVVVAVKGWGGWGGGIVFQLTVLRRRSLENNVWGIIYLLSFSIHYPILDNIHFQLTDYTLSALWPAAVYATLFLAKSTKWTISDSDSESCLHLR